MRGRRQCGVDAGGARSTCTDQDVLATRGDGCFHRWQRFFQRATEFCSGAGGTDGEGTRRSNRARLYAAAGFTVMLLAGVGCLVHRKLVETSEWVKVYSDGAYVGMVPNDESVLASIRRLALGYDVNVSLQPVHTLVPKSYDWSAVCELPTPATAIVADGRPIVYTRDVAAAQRVLEEVRHALWPEAEGHATGHFRQDISLRPVTVGVTQVVSADAAVQEILYPQSNSPVQRLENRSG
ncbi:MAG: hypothetical protein K6T68_05670, partial [Alicyclobacillus shizuokensis]|nr:hypothetical protein [Alicyclobacillus shizuokensis]